MLPVQVVQAEVHTTAVLAVAVLMTPETTKLEVIRYSAVTVATRLLVQATQEMEPLPAAVAARTVTEVEVMAQEHVVNCE